ncbi:MAG: molybdopterin-binding protein [Hadesarchaea archaeon B3_Hades]|nr:MAG: molybdopterin-binding protein [Hadesarchaea archaeon B3_Hades]
MKKVKVEDAIGEPLAHDVVRYGPGIKTVLFKRGHVVRVEDIEQLKDAGNYFVYVGGEEEGVHEDEAAIRMARAAMGENLSQRGPDKGSITLIAEKPGLLKVKVDVIKQVNLIDDFTFVTRVNDTGVKKGAVVGAAKIVPLTVDENRMRKVEEILEKNKPVFQVISPKIKKVGVIVTGTEVYDGRIKDAFVPVLKEKLGEYGLDVHESTILPDDEEKIKEKILEFKEKGHELILVAGGMAVDSGDLTPTAIKNTGADVVSRGAPTFPGAMIMLAYLDGVPILGLPACVLPDKRTSFDRILPRVLAKEKITREEIAELGHGGFAWLGL